MSTKLIALILIVSMLGLGGVADARTGGGRHGGSHHAARSAGHVRHVSRLGRRTRRTRRVYAHRPVRVNTYAYRTHRSLRRGHRLNHAYVYNRVNWPNMGYTHNMNRRGLFPNTSATMGGSNSITVPAMVTLPRNAVS